ncbi:MAG: hypothetical protein AB1482_13265 [Pseudomonadota bacterium]
MKRMVLVMLLLLQGRVLAASGTSFDVLSSVMDTTKKELNAKQETEKGRKDFQNSKYGRLYKDGYWQFFQGK